MTRSIRRCAFALPLLLVASAAAAAGDAGAPQSGAEPEAEVLIPKGRNGGWGAPVVHFSTVRDRAAVFLGGRGGWLLGGRLTLGGAGFGLASSVPAPPEVERPGERLDLEMGYGGGWIEYTFTPLRLVHFSVGALIGGGGVSLKWHDGGSYGSGSDGFFVMEPAVMAELNVASFVRADVGVAYRWIVGADMRGLSYSDVAGFSVIAALKFGRF